MIYSTIVPIRAAPLSASQSDILLRGGTLQKEETIFPQFVNWQSPIDMIKIMLQTDPDCYFHSEGFNARVCLHAKNIFIYLLYWSGHTEIRSHNLLSRPVHFSTTTGSSRIVSFSPEMVAFQAAKGNQAQAACKILHKLNPGSEKP